MSDLAYKQCQTLLDAQNKDLQEGLTLIRELFNKYTKMINKHLDQIEARLDNLEAKNQDDGK
jgi:DNA-binding transcriptional MerR regulator